jgi:shikimate dehydrogenase/3-dehydroquinate dehydratase type I
MTLVVGSLVERDAEGIAASSKLAFAQGADLVECRLDHLSHVSRGSVEEARRAALGPAISALRSRSEGGRSGLRGDKRNALLQAQLYSDFEYVDLELRTDGKFISGLNRERWDSKLIVSAHFLKPVKRPEIERALGECTSLGDVGKVAMVCEDATDALMLAEVGMKWSQRRKPCVVIGIGPHGQLTRILADRLGSALAYSCISGKPAAPGQLDIPTQSKLRNKDKTVLGLVGHPVSHSVSKPMQEEAMEKAGMIGAYVPMDFPLGEFSAGSIGVMRRLGFIGINVTIPHKKKAYSLCGQRGPAAKATGAVNTIKIEAGRLYGENTDVKGFAELIGGKTVITRGTKALLVGAGGAARAAMYVLKERGARVTVVDIEKRRADHLAKAFEAHSQSLPRLFKSGKHFGIVVNCSPVGMKGVPGNPVVRSLFRPGSAFFDVVYNPQITKAMQTAEKAGAKAHGGLEMLVQQGAESFRIWTGVEPNLEAMREAARRALA